MAIEGFVEVFGGVLRRGFGVRLPALRRLRGTWADPDAYDTKARELAAMFRANFEKRFAADADPAVAAAGPVG